MLRRAMMAGGGDPYWANVVSLLHMDGANGSTTFTDQKGKTWTPNGNVQISTAQSVFGGSSAAFDGVNDSLSIASHADFGFGTGDWTVECFVRQTTTAAQVIFDCRSGSSQALVAYITSGGNLAYYDTSEKAGSGATIPPATWTHIALSRTAGVIKMFVGGVQVFSGALATDMGSSMPFRIGEDYTGSADFNGYIDEFRITKGVGRYTSGFTPPASPFPNS